MKIYKTYFTDDNVLNTRQFIRFVIFQLYLEKAVFKLFKLNNGAFSKAKYQEFGKLLSICICLVYSVYTI